MDKINILCVTFLLGWLCAISVQAATAFPDSIITDDNVYRYMFTDTPKAEAIMDELRRRKKLPEWELDYVEGDLYFNTVRYYQALKFYKRVLESNRVQKDSREAGPLSLPFW